MNKKNMIKLTKEELAVKIFETARNLLNAEKTLSKAKAGKLKSPFAISETPLVREQEAKNLKDLVKQL
jgi:hypothetical protein